MEKSESGQMRVGMADRNKIETGMIIKFEGPIHGWSQRDMLIIKDTDGQTLPFSAADKDADDNLIVQITRDQLEPGRLAIVNLAAKLIPISEDSARLELYDHNAGLFS